MMTLEPMEKEQMSKAIKALQPICTLNGDCTDCPMCYNDCRLCVLEEMKYMFKIFLENEAEQ